MTQKPQTRWNGESCQARRVTAIVADNGTFPQYWARHLVGTRRHVVEVTYGGSTFYIDNEDGAGWNKVTRGGSPHWGHSSLTIEPDSIQPCTSSRVTEPETSPLRDQLTEAANALHAIGRACIVVQPTLDVPYTDDPRWSPWTRWVQRPARIAYNLGILMRRQLGISRRPLPQWQSNAATRLYDAARQLSDQTIGHTETCEWHTNGNAYCSCVAYGAACAGVDAVLEALAEVDASEPSSPEVVHSDASPQASAPSRVDDPGDAKACAHHPNAPVIGGVCGGCTQYPTDMIKER